MNNNSSVDYRRALEALRSGVPNRDAVRLLGCNQREVERSFLERLSSVHAAGQETKQAPGLLIAGGFGTGKSHLLEYLEHVSTERRFVCSRVVISKETPLFDLAKFYLAAIDGATVPGLNGQAIHEIALRLQPKSGKYAEFYQWANAAGNGLSPLFPATLLLHERLSNDPELVDQITGFWSGEHLAISEIRRGMKQINSSGMYALKPVRVKELALQRFIFASHLILAAGFSGWVILIDEVELIGRYSILQRGRSYAELARWMGKVEGKILPGVIAVAAITDDFALAVLQERHDRDTVADKLRAKQTDEYTMLAARAETGMRVIERDALTLEVPDESGLADTYEKLCDIHGRAYGWQPPSIAAGETALTRRMRSYVRRWVNEWDIRRLYPGVNVSTEEETGIKPTYEQDESLEQHSEATAEE